MQLAASLAGVISQRLVPKVDGGMVAAFEVLIAKDAVRNLVREGKTHQIRNVMHGSRGEGMLTLEASLNERIAAGLITRRRGTVAVAAPEGDPRSFGAHRLIRPPRGPCRTVVPRMGRPCGTPTQD